MTDKEKLITLLKEFDLGFEENDREYLPNIKVITITSGDKKMIGTLGFSTAFYFSKSDEKFLEAGVWNDLDWRRFD